MSRRSTRIKANEAKVATPETHKYQTRRQSSFSNASLVTTQLDKTSKNYKFLTNEDIANSLENSEDEHQNDRSKEMVHNYSISRVNETSLVHKFKRVDIRLTRLDTENIDFNKKKQQTNNLTSLKPSNSRVNHNVLFYDSTDDAEIQEKRPSRQKSNKNLNEDFLFKSQMEQIEEVKPRVLQKINNSVKSTRKRAASNNYRKIKEDYNTSEDDDKEVDENSIPNANKSPKRTKPIHDLMKTPTRKSSRTPAKTPIRFRKTSLSPDKNSSISSITTPKKQILKTRESNRKSFKRQGIEKKRNIQYDSYLTDSDLSESGDDNDKTISEHDCESESKSETEDTETSEDDDNEFIPKHRRIRNKNLLTIPRTPCKTPKKVSVDTPTKSMAKMCLTPSMHQRTVNIVKPSTPLQEARLKLHVSVLPKSLPCREELFNDIYTFLHARLSDKSGGCIYISGVPGTGKTATVSEVIRCLKKARDTGKLTQFEYIDINGMKLSEPRQAYVQIWKQLTGQQTTWEEAHKLLQGRFSKSNSSRGMTLLLVDELDLLCTKRQDVVYNLLDWPTKTSAKLVVVTIANTMDLPERVFMGKVTSRLGLSRLTFPPYNHKQLEEIVVSRLRGYNAFGGETIQLVARKVAAVSGDARRALDICRRATEIAENKNQEIVSMMDVKQAVDEMIASPKIQAIKHCSELERLFLQAVCTEVHRTGIEEVIFKNVYVQLAPLCTLNGEQTPNVTEVLAMCARLGAWRLLLCEHSRMDIHQRILLNVSVDDVQFAMKAIEV